MELKINAYVARDATFSSSGNIISTRARIHYSKPHLKSITRLENGRVTSRDEWWVSDDGDFIAPYGSFTDLNWNDEPRKVLITINDAEFDDYEQATD